MGQKEMIDAMVKRTVDAGKTYTFKEEHNPRLPADFWFQNAKEGKVLFVVFYTLACRWAKCLGCNLPSQVSGEYVPFDMINRQIDYVFDYILTPEDKKDLRKIIVSNNGSILDEETFSTTSLFYFIARMNEECPNISVLTLETRPEYVEVSEVELLARAIAEGKTPTELEFAIGFEAFDAKIRNDYYLKGLSLDVFERFAKDVARFKHSLKTYFMLKPVPDLSEEDAVEDLKDAIDYLDTIAVQYDLKINIHINPTYAAKETPLETAFKEGRFVPPKLESAKEVILHGRGKKLSIFVGLDDEGLAVPGGSFLREEEKDLQKKLDLFNQTQNFSLLED